MYADRLFFGLYRRDIIHAGEVYMRRYILQLPTGHTLRLHNIRRQDLDRDPHDHQWSFASWVVRGGYREERHHNGVTSYETRRPSFRPAVRRATDLHRIIRVEPNTWTFVITSGRERKWGYATPEGWVLAKNYWNHKVGKWSEVNE